VSDNKYPRVTDGRLVAGFWDSDPDGTHKVAPADAIVIERGDRTAMTEGMARAYVTNALGYTSTRIEITDDVLDRADAHARHLLSAIEYLRANPPVDEELVERLAHTITGQQEHFGCADGWDFMDLARRLVQAGVRVEVTP